MTVQIASGGGSLEGATTATSDADGEVAFTDLAISGSPGTRRLIFAAEAFAPATSAPIALGVGAPTSIELVAGDDQTATVGEPVPIDPSVRVRDADGNPLSGIPVTFTVTGGDGSVVRQHTGDRRRRRGHGGRVDARPRRRARTSCRPPCPGRT